MFTLLKMLYKLRALIGPPARLFHLLVGPPRRLNNIYCAVVDDDRVPFNEPFRSFLSLDRDKSLWLGRPAQSQMRSSLPSSPRCRSGKQTSQGTGFPTSKWYPFPPSISFIQLLRWDHLGCISRGEISRCVAAKLSEGHFVACLRCSTYAKIHWDCSWRKVREGVKGRDRKRWGTCKRERNVIGQESALGRTPLRHWRRTKERRHLYRSFEAIEWGKSCRRRGEMDPI